MIHALVRLLWGDFLGVIIQDIYSYRNFLSFLCHSECGDSHFSRESECGASLLGASVLVSELAHTVFRNHHFVLV